MPDLSCPQIDPKNIDNDGMPLAPSEVAASPVGAWSVFRCAIEQAKTYHVPTQDEITHMHTLLDAFNQSKLNGITKDTTKIILDNADALSLQVCRLKTMRGNNVDSILLFYTKPGITDYSGPFMMLRETKSSLAVILSPHDGSDGTFAATKLGMQNTYALACFSDGHHRTTVSHGDINLKRESDWCHCKSVDLNLGDVAIAKLADLYPHQVALMLHGSADPHVCLVHCRDDNMKAVFEKALADNTRLNANDFKGFPVWFTTDEIIKSQYYLKCEIPAAIYMNNYSVVTDIVKAMEQNSWCWDNGKVGGV